MSNTAKALSKERERWRQYKRNRRTDETTDDVTPLVGYDVDPSDMSDGEIEKQYWHLQRLREKEMGNNDPRNLAIEMSKRQMKLYRTAQRRGFEDQLANEEKSKFA
jgi:hypothetical protein